jgi:hypothetical protein
MFYFSPNEGVLVVMTGTYDIEDIEDGADLENTPHEQVHLFNHLNYLGNGVTKIFSHV